MIDRKQLKALRFEDEDYQFDKMTRATKIFGDLVVAAQIGLQIKQMEADAIQRKRMNAFYKAQADEAGWVDQQKVKLRSFQENIERHNLNIKKAEEQGNSDLANKLRIEKDKLENEARQARTTIAQTMSMGPARQQELAAGEASRFADYESAVGSTSDLTDAMSSGMGGGMGSWGQIFNQAKNVEGSDLKSQFTDLNKVTAEINKVQDIQRLNKEASSDLGMVDLDIGAMSPALTEEGRISQDKLSKDVADKRAASQQALIEGESKFNIPQTKIIQPAQGSQKYGALASIAGDLSSLFKNKTAKTTGGTTGGHYSGPQ